MGAQTDERTPLLPAASDRETAASPASTTGTETTETLLVRLGPKDGRGGAAKSWLAEFMTPANRVLLAGFIISLSFGFTQVS